MAILDRFHDFPHPRARRRDAGFVATLGRIRI
jgi:hypothetical protein